MKNLKYIGVYEGWTYILNISEKKNGFSGEYVGKIHPKITPDNGWVEPVETIEDVLEESAKELFRRRGFDIKWEQIEEQ